jgi:receptor protein-tyrosine kinase
MSLIERAVDRLELPPPSRGRPTHAAAPHAAASPPAAAPPSAPGRHAPRTPQIPIDLDALGTRGFAIPGSGVSAVGQAFRMIKRPLLGSAFGKGAAPVERGRRVMVTSAFPGEGKSFCAINLALSIAAERDHHVLLVDADVARPSIPAELGVEPGPGLMDWLLERAPDLDRLVRPTSVDKLSLLMSGRQHPNATELLASDEMARLVEELSTRYPDRIVIFDSPPLLVTTESRVLASHMGQIVMVVEAGRTPRDAVNEALASVGSTGVVGLVLNKSRETRVDGYYGYQGYGYGVE